MPSSAVRGLLLTAGTVCLGLGVAGIIVPVLPTTPFLLLASACFLRSSERLHRWLTGHRYLGSYIRTFERGQAIPLRGKAVAISLIWLSMLFSILMLDTLSIEIVLVLIGITVTLWIASRPTLPPERQEPSAERAPE
jgi:uncharacterized membrane protein YbaN (DUF454 family)